MLRFQDRFIWFLTGVMAAVLGLWGVLERDLYTGLIDPNTRAGALSQDAISALAGMTLCVLALGIPSRAVKRQLVALGLLGYLFYAYGIYAVERVYNLLYLGYLAVFGLAFWSLLFGALRVASDFGAGASLDRFTRRLSAAGALLQPVIFYPMWIGMLIPLMTQRRQINSLYSIFILDLCFVMPAFGLIAMGTLANRASALVLAPVMYVLGAALIFSLALGELFKPLFGFPVTARGLLPSVGLTLLFVALGALHLTRLRLPPARTRTGGGGTNPRRTEKDDSPGPATPAYDGVGPKPRPAGATDSGVPGPASWKIEI